MSDSLYDLNLPEVPPGEGPLPCPPPSYELMLAHAHFLISAGLANPDAPERQPNPEPFVLD